MPLQPMFYEPMVNPFRDMMKDVEAKGLTGEDVDQMRAQLTFMEQLAQQVDDIAAYTGQLAQENTFQKFSDAYSRALSSAAKAEAKGQSDEEMMASALSAYEQAAQTYRSGDVGETGALLLPFMEQILAIGRSGVSFPVFLRTLEERGLNRVLDGTAPAVLDGLQRSLGFAQQAWNRYGIEKTGKLLAIFQKMEKEAAFGQPDPLAFSLQSRRLDWEFEPLEARWEAELRRWQAMLDNLVDWLDSFTSFAFYDTRWRTPGASDAQVRKNIQRTQECGPGEFRYREAVYARYFRADWEAIWSCESFTWEYSARRIEWSDDRLHLIRATYAHCQPGQKPPAALVAQAEKLHPDGDYRADKLQHPPWGTPISPFVK